jgi:hypothetical protein
MKTLYVKKTLNLKLIFGSLILMLANTGTAIGGECPEGGSCGGGGNTIGNETVDSYLDHHKEDAQKIRKEVEPVLAKLRSQIPEFVKELELGLENLDWIFVESPLTVLPLTRTELPFATDQTAVQIGSKVDVYKKGAEKLKEEEYRKLLVHELVRRIQLSGEGTNVLLTPSSAFDATNILMKAVNDGMETAELKEELESIGYDSVPQLEFFAAPKKEVNRKPAFADPIRVPLRLRRPISLKIAREAVHMCIAGGMNRADLAQDTLIGQLFLRHLDKLPKELWDREHLVQNGLTGSGCSSYFPQSYPPSVMTASSRCDFSTKPTQGANDGFFLGNAYMNGSFTENPQFDFQLPADPERYVVGGGNWISVTAVPTAALPKVQYRVKDGERLLTDWGLVNEGMLLDTIWMVTERDQYHDRRKVSLKNRATDAIINSLKLDTRTFVDCVDQQVYERSLTRGELAEDRLGREVNRSKAQKHDSASGNAGATKKGDARDAH